MGFLPLRGMSRQESFYLVLAIRSVNKGLGFQILLDLGQLQPQLPQSVFVDKQLVVRGFVMGDECSAIWVKLFMDKLDNGLAEVSFSRTLWLWGHTVIGTTVEHVGAHTLCRDRLHAVESQGSAIRGTRDAASRLHSPAWLQPITNRLQRSLWQLLCLLSEGGAQRIRW